MTTETEGQTQAATPAVFPIAEILKVVDELRNPGTLAWRDAVSAILAVANYAWAQVPPALMNASAAGPHNLSRADCAVDLEGLCKKGEDGQHVMGDAQALPWAQILKVLLSVLSGLFAK